MSDFANTHHATVRMLAGQGGLARPVKGVGILDYELVPGLKNRYQRVNFEEGQLVLSTFLYAKDDPFLIGEAVKYLVAKGTSGLVIKNVFHLQIPDAALRYANARNYPLLLVTSDDLFFDEVIGDIEDRVKLASSDETIQHELDAMRADGLTPPEVKEHALRIDPSLKDEFVVMFADPKEDLSDVTYGDIEEAYRRSDLSGPESVFCRCDGGLLLVISKDTEEPPDAHMLLDIVTSDVLGEAKAMSIGASETHYSLDEMALAMDEAQRASTMADRRNEGAIAYGDLGVLRAIMPHADSPSMKAYMNQVLGPIREFDDETGSHLDETLMAYFSCDEDTSRTAAELGQHANTIRYRMGKVAKITGLDYRAPSEREQLCLACRIATCLDIMAVAR
ncbi:MAG: PucR family transcriptional regulator [Atopobiaceae bacterium]|nr:PucR family transcriptional regulator [Atopobiaceae bacterium]MCI2208133.1 PucR family transcriptional regulator [Atopobiaceae bacterium]